MALLACAVPYLAVTAIPKQSKCLGFLFSVLLVNVPEVMPITRAGVGDGGQGQSGWMKDDVLTFFSSEK